MRSARWLWLTGTILALGLMGAVGFMVRAHLAIRRDAQAVRDALAAGRPGWAVDPLARWLRPSPRRPKPTQSRPSSRWPRAITPR